MGADSRRAFSDRLADGLMLERRVIEQLGQRGWLAEPFGQGLLSPAMRRRLRRTKSPARWLPDIVAARRLPNSRTELIFIDTKRGRDDTDLHAVEVAALAAAESWSEFSRCPFWFVLGDQLDVIAPDAVRATSRPGPDRGHGSGTPYVLVPQAACRTFAIFGTGGDRQ